MFSRLFQTNIRKIVEIDSWVYVWWNDIKNMYGKWVFISIQLRCVLLKIIQKQVICHFQMYIIKHPFNFLSDMPYVVSKTTKFDGVRNDAFL